MDGHITIIRPPKVGIKQAHERFGGRRSTHMCHANAYGIDGAELPRPRALQAVVVPALQRQRRAQQQRLPWRVRDPKPAARSL